MLDFSTIINAVCFRLWRTQLFCIVNIINYTYIGKFIMSNMTSENETAISVRTYV